MKKLNEWRNEVDQTENPDVLMDKLHELAHQIQLELASFKGERFDGLLNVMGSVKNLQRSLAEIQHGIVGQTPTYEDVASQPAGPRPMKKINRKEVVSAKVRKGADDLSSDYKGHIGMNGEEAPLKVMRKK